MNTIPRLSSEHPLITLTALVENLGGTVDHGYAVIPPRAQCGDTAAYIMADGTVRCSGHALRPRVFHNQPAIVGPLSQSGDPGEAAECQAPGDFQVPYVTVQLPNRPAFTVRRPTFRGAASVAREYVSSITSPEAL